MGTTARDSATKTALSQRTLCHDLVQYVAAATLATSFPEDVGLDPEVRHRFQMIQKQLGQMRVLLQDCLEPPSGDDLADVVEIVRECVAAASLRHPIDLHVGPATAELRGNHGMLQRAVSNLLDNAIRAAREEGTVTLKVTGSDDLVTIEVIDTGVGFGRIHSGHGLGMVSVADALSSFNGSLEITSAPETGTNVRLVLPRSWS